MKNNNNWKYDNLCWLGKLKKLWMRLIYKYLAPISLASHNPAYATFHAYRSVSVSVCASLKIISLKLISKLKDTYTSLTHTKAHHDVDLAIAAVLRQHRCDRPAVHITDLPNSSIQQPTQLSRIQPTWPRSTSNSISSINWWSTTTSDDARHSNLRSCNTQLRSLQLEICIIKLSWRCRSNNKRLNNRKSHRRMS